MKGLGGFAAISQMMEGFNPDTLKQAGAAIQDAAQRLQRIEAKLDRIEAKLDLLEAAPEPAPENVEVPAALLPAVLNGRADG